MATLTNCQYMVDGRKGPGKGVETSFKSEYNLEFKCFVLLSEDLLSFNSPNKGTTGLPFKSFLPFS